MKKLILILLLIISVKLSAQTTAIPDANFEQALINLGYDVALDGTVLTANIDTITILWVQSANISDITGIEDFTALRELNCSNNQLTSINVTQNTVLNILTCSNNQIPNIDVTQNTALTTLTLDLNPITSLDVTQNTALTYLRSLNNQMLTIDVTQNTALATLNISGNPITSLDVTQNTVLTTLNVSSQVLPSLDVTQNTALSSMYCGGCISLTNLDVTQNIALTYLNITAVITSLDVSQNTALVTLDVSSSSLTSLDLTQNTALTTLRCQYNSLTSLDVKNGNNSNITVFNTASNPNLTCINVDSVAYSITNWISIDPWTSFSANCCPGLALNTDSVNNISCLDSGKVFVSANGGLAPYNFTWMTTPLSIGSTLTTDSSGLYIIQLTDSNNCNLSKGVLIDGPQEMNSFDLNTSLNSPTFRPGLLSQLNLSAWNDGCVLTSGQLSISYSGPITFNSGTITPDSISSNTLFWNFTNWNYDTPQFLSDLGFMVDSMANIGDLVCFDINITPLIGDADTSNNFKTYCFGVLNSYDPNDKQVYPRGVCADNYVLKDAPLTYTVRFQNTGTAPALDIYLLDTLTSNLDINTLRIISNSHNPLITEVIEDSIVKFRFDNINLIDSLSNEQGSKGYVTYEIYPKSGLSDGTVIENSAAIYFDLNPPVITNATMNTLISVLPIPIITVMNENLGTGFTLNYQTYTDIGTYNQYFYASNGCDSIVVLNLTSTVGINNKTQLSAITVYPNPTSGQLSISLAKGTATAITISNSLGQLLLSEKIKATNQVTLDLSAYPTGIYFLQLVVDGQVITKKVMKE